MWGSTIPTTLTIKESPLFAAAVTRSASLAHILSTAIKSRDGHVTSPLPSSSHNSSGVLVKLPPTLPLGPLFDSLCTLDDLPFSVQAAGHGDETPGTSTHELPLDAFIASLRASTLLTRGEAASLSLPMEKIRQCFDAAIFGNAKQRDLVTSSSSSAAASSVIIPLRVVLRSTQALKDTLVVLQEGVPSKTPLLAALEGLLHSAGARYCHDARFVLLVDEGGLHTQGTHVCILNGVEVHAVKGMFSAPIGEVAKDAGHHDGWLYIMHNDGNRNFRVSRARVVAGENCGPWEDFVAEDENGAVLEDMDM